MTNKIEVAYLLFESICLVDTQNGHRRWCVADTFGFRLELRNGTL